MNDPQQREENLFNAAIQLEKAEEREAYLKEACADDEPLRLRVEALLQGHEQTNALLDKSLERTFILPASMVQPVEKPGDKIGSYKLREKIGEGGCGVVYVAEQEEPIRRRVALKVIKLGMDTKQVIARFEAERQALAMMDHPNIAKVLDAGATDAGRPYFVMELVRGIRITDYCDQNNLSTTDRLKLFSLVCQAIQHAHQKGIIHRDIKPSNILVTLHDGVPVPKVIDFGIAKATEGRLTDMTVYTELHQFIGTPAYMSPEQAEMSGLDIDTRSDIYALGVLLYELLTGSPPFDQKELMAAGLDEMRRTIREKEPARPSTRLETMIESDRSTVAKHRGSEVPKLVHLLQGDLDWIVMKALEKDRTRRYETANGFAKDIQRHLNNEPVVARPQSNLYRFQKMVRRNKLVVTTVSAVAAALIIGLGASTWMFFKEKEDRQRAVAAEREQIHLRETAQKAQASEAKLRQQAEANEKKAETAASKSQQVAKFLEEMLTGVGPSVALGRDTRLLREIVDATAQRLDKDLKDQPAVEAELRVTLGKVYSDLGEYTNSAAMHRKALELRKKLFGVEHPDTASSLYELGEALRKQAQHSEAEPVVREALRIRKKLFGNEHVEVAESLDSLALLIYFWRSKWNEAEALLREALAIRRKLQGSEHVEVATSLEHLGILLNARGKFAEAEATHREALALRRKLLSGDHPDIATAIHQVAWSLSLEHKLADAEGMFREALAMRRRFLGNEHPDTTDTLLNLGGTLHLEKKYGEAEVVIREALNNRKRLGNNSPAIVSPLKCLADILESQGKLTEAEAVYREALAINTDSYGNWFPSRVKLLDTLAGLLRKEGKLEEAKTVYDQSAEHYRKAAERGDAPSLNAFAWRLATSAAAEARDGINAVNLAEEAVAKTNRKEPDFLDTLAAAYAEVGQFANAVAVQKEAIGVVKDAISKKDFSSRLKLYESNSPYHGNYTIK